MSFTNQIKPHKMNFFITHRMHSGGTLAELVISIKTGYAGAAKYDCDTLTLFDFVSDTSYIRLLFPTKSFANIEY